MNPIMPLRIFIPLLLLLFLALVGFSSYLYMSSQGELEVEERSVASIKQLSKMLQASTNIMFRRNNFDAVRTQLTSLATDKQINFAIIVNENGIVKVAADKKHQGKKITDVVVFLNDTKVSRFLKTNAGNVFLSKDRLKVQSVYPVRLPKTSANLRSEQVGLLVLEKNISNSKTTKQIQVEKYIVAYLILMLGLSALMGLFSHFLITHRVARLVEVTGKFSNGNLSVRVGLRGKDEFAQIGNALDVMAATLRAKEYELAASEERLRKSQKFANMGSWDWNIETGDLIWSETIASMFGINISEDEVSYDLFINSVHPDDRQALELAIQNSVENNENYDIQHRIVEPNGNIRWIHETGKVERDERGKPLRMLGMVRDITADKEFDIYVQEILLELHHQKNALDKHSIVVETDLTGTITYSNVKFSEISGYSNKELLGKTHRIINSGFHSKEFFAEMWRTINDGEIWQGEVCNRKKNGDHYWVDTTIVPCFDDEGKSNKFIAIRTDITERKHAETQSRLQVSALKATADGIVITNKAGNIQWINPAYTKLTGYSFDEVVGQNPRILKSGKQDRVFYKNLWDTILSGKTWHGELWNKRKDGELYLEEESITPILGQTGEIEHFVAIKRDISERQQLQKQLQQAQKMEAIGQLTGGIAHDFNNILASIMGYTELAREELKQFDHKLVDGYLNNVYISGKRARDLVAQMLAFSRGGEGELKPLTLSPLINESLKMLGATLPSSIEIDLQLDNDDLIIMTNPVQIHQLIMNLCINARDAMGGKGHLTIKVQRVNNLVMECRSCHERVSGDFIEVMVRDTGSGIKPEQLDRIFDPFFTTKEVGKGSGMGLSMVHGIVHDHGGHVLVETIPDESTTFTLLFPAIKLEVNKS